MKKEKLDKWGYPIHPEMNFLKPEGDFETRIALAIAFSLIITWLIIFPTFYDPGLQCLTIEWSS